MIMSSYNYIFISESVWMLGYQCNQQSGVRSLLFFSSSVRQTSTQRRMAATRGMANQQIQILERSWLPGAYWTYKVSCWRLHQVQCAFSVWHILGNFASSRLIVKIEYNFVHPSQVFGVICTGWPREIVSLCSTILLRYRRNAYFRG